MIMGSLVAKDLIRPVSILVARVLPDSTNQNAIKNLHAYDSINRILYLKQTLLNATPGAVSVAIQHVCAHIKAGDLRSDNHPAFRAEFFNFLPQNIFFYFYCIKSFVFKFQVESLELFSSCHVHLCLYRHLRASWQSTASSYCSC